MLNITHKPPTHRQAEAQIKIYLQPETIRLIRSGKVPKGDVQEAARLAGILAAKATPQLIPLCHPICLTGASVEFEFKEDGIRILTRVECLDRTGAEMEALTAAAVAALTIYDMCKAVDGSMVIGDLRLLRKSGGRSSQAGRVKQPQG